MKEWTVTVTEDDLRFVEDAKQDYSVFAEASEKQGEAKATGFFRKREFYAERFALRIKAEGGAE